jgi:hypothetical protein
MAQNPPARIRITRSASKEEKERLLERKKLETPSKRAEESDESDESEKSDEASESVESETAEQDGKVKGNQEEATDEDEEVSETAHKKAPVASRAKVQRPKPIRKADFVSVVMEGDAEDGNVDDQEEEQEEEDRSQPVATGKKAKAAVAVKGKRKQSRGTETQKNKGVTREEHDHALMTARLEDDSLAPFVWISICDQYDSDDIREVIQDVKTGASRRAALKRHLAAAQKRKQEREAEYEFTEKSEGRGTKRGIRNRFYTPATVQLPAKKRRVLDDEESEATKPSSSGSEEEIVRRPRQPRSKKAQNKRLPEFDESVDSPRPKRIRRSGHDSSVTSDKNNSRPRGRPVRQRLPLVKVKTGHVPTLEELRARKEQLKGAPRSTHYRHEDDREIGRHQTDESQPSSIRIIETVVYDGSREVEQIDGEDNGGEDREVAPENQPDDTQVVPQPIAVIRLSTPEIKQTLDEFAQLFLPHGDQRVAQETNDDNEKDDIEDVSPIPLPDGEATELMSEPHVASTARPSTLTVAPIVLEEARPVAASASQTAATADIDADEQDASIGDPMDSLVAALTTGKSDANKESSQKLSAAVADDAERGMEEEVTMELGLNMEGQMYAEHGSQPVDQAGEEEMVLFSQPM